MSVRAWAGVTAFLFLVSGGIVGAKPDQVVYPLILEQVGGPVSLGDSWMKKNDARAAARELEGATEGLTVTPSPASLVGEENGSGIVYPLLVEHENGENYVARVHTEFDAARQAAMNLGLEGNTWVIVGPSRVRDKHEALVARLMRGIIPSPALFAETVINASTSSLILPAASHSGALSSPDVRFTTQFAMISIKALLPVDADWANTSNSLTGTMEWSPDSGGTWNYMCELRWNGPGFRPNGKDGNPVTGTQLGCQNVNGQTGQPLPISTWYHLKVLIPQAITVGAEILLSAQH